MTNQKELWREQKEANYEARQILGIGPRELIVGDLSDDAFRHAIAMGGAKSLKELDEQYGLENWYRTEEESFGLYFCGKCRKSHFFKGSKIGQKHLHHRIDWERRALDDRLSYHKLLE